MRPEEEARREAQSAAARGEQPEPTEVNVPVLEQRTYSQFLLAPVVALPDGGKAVQFLAGGGVLHVFPLNGESARQLGQQLVAPSVQVAAADEMPGGGTNGRVPGGEGR